MATQEHDQIKNEIKGIVLVAIRERIQQKVSSTIGTNCFYINRDNFNDFLKTVRVRRVESDGECCLPGQATVASLCKHHFSGHSREDEDYIGKGKYIAYTIHGKVRIQLDEQICRYKAPCSGMDCEQGCVIHSHKILLSVQADYKVETCYIPMYFGGGGLAESPELILGAANGAVAGAGIGSIVPVVGTIFGCIIGGAVGLKRALRSDFKERYEDKSKEYVLEAEEIFSRLEDFSKSGNTCYCTVIAKTSCPYQE